LLDDPMWIVLPAGHHLAGRDSLGIADLAGERRVHGCLSMGDTLDHYAALARFKVRTACRGTDYVFAQSLVRAAVGISMIPQVAPTADQGGRSRSRSNPLPVAVRGHRHPTPPPESSVRRHAARPAGHGRRATPTVPPMKRPATARIAS
jgi:DNA-binding transcriptional LysR family regulator